MQLKIRIEPHDIWVGVYWYRCWEAEWKAFEWDVYVCPLPMLCLHFTWVGKRKEAK